MTTTPSLNTPLNRRRLLSGMGALTALGLLGCKSDNGSNNTSTSSGSSSTDDTSSTSGTSSTTESSTSSGTCTIIPTETIGPFPLLALLSNSLVVRKDIREDRTGLPLTVRLTLVNVNDGCRPLANTAVYIWHCDLAGEYSGYSSSQNGSHANETWLRGVQVTDENGVVEFTTIYPGWYPGRITHIHFQAYLGNNLNVTAIATSQMAFPQATTQAVYNSSLYSSQGQNTSVTSFSTDNVFSDGTTYQMTTISGSINSGLTASLTAGIAA